MAKVLSIQGEQEQDVQETLWASDESVDTFVRDVDERFLLCRDRVRHGYRTVTQAVAAGLEFTGETPDGFLERRELCPDCKAVERVEVWDVSHNRRTGKVTKCKLISSYTHYVDMTYQNARGEGRMKATQIRSAIATQAMGETNYRKLVADAKKRQKERQEAQRAAMKAQLELVDSA